MFNIIKNYFAGILLLGLVHIVLADILIGQAFGRCKCMRQRQVTGCSENLFQAYPNLSRSADDLRVPDTCVFLFTNTEPENAEFLHECGGKLPVDTNFQKGKQTVVIVHGFSQDTCLQLWPRDMKNEFIKKGDYNIIIVDYSWNNMVDSHYTALNSKLIGDQLGVIIDNIKNQTGATEDDFYLVGFSQGADIAGFIGDATKVRRITGIEPAGPYYQGKPVVERLDRHDAKLVDVMHTSSSRCAPFFSLPNAVGDVDFYVNGGSIQPHCTKSGLEAIIRGDFITGIQYLVLETACFHFQSIRYYISTINPSGCELWGTECSSYEAYKAGTCGTCSRKGPNCAIMGLDWDKSPKINEDEPTTYYLDITAPCPYCTQQTTVLPGLA